MDGHDRDMLRRENAVETVMTLRTSALAEQPEASVALDRIGGRTLAEDIIAQRDLPAHDHATMDGYAFDAAEEYPFNLVGTCLYPGDDPPPLDCGQAVEIATGARLPQEANAVLKREDAEIENGQLFGTGITPGTYTYERGSNVTEGERLFSHGEQLAAKDAILLCDLGLDDIRVHGRFSVAVLATGTELHEGARRDVDSPMLCSLVRAWGHRATYQGTVPDDRDSIRCAITDMTEDYDVIVTTGGTSVGDEDYVVQTLAELGEVQFHRVRIRPGKPIAVATVDGTIAFAIPGKPLGAYTSSILVMRPFFVGRNDLPSREVELTCDLEIGPEGFEYVVPVDLENETATPLGHAESSLQLYGSTFDPSVLSSTTRATRGDGFMLTRTAISAGESVDVVPYEVVE